MSDPTVEEIWINSPHRIFIARGGMSQLTNMVLKEEDIRDLVERLLMWGGRRLDLSHPFVDARLPDGSRLHVAIPDVTAMHWAVNIRKHLIRSKSLSNLAELGVMTPEIANYLSRAVGAGMNLLVSGSTQAGKTTLLNALVGAVPLHSRVITIEEVFELKPQLPDCIALQTRQANLQGEGEIPLRKLIKEALRMRPSHLVVGEIREAEALDLLIALNSGLPGMATIHANSARDAIAKLQTLPLLAGENITFQFIAPLVATTIDLIVHTTILQGTGERRIVEISHVTGRTEGDRAEIETLFIFRDGKYESGLGDPNRIFKDMAIEWSESPHQASSSLELTRSESGDFARNRTESGGFARNRTESGGFARNRTEPGGFARKSSESSVSERNGAEANSPHRSPIQMNGSSGR
jgi:pilus assembly protein CpaF